ncbi:TRAPP subunit [Tilletia horrida]|nr:TRAPP subunit [Tilletia horrida]
MSYYFCIVGTRDNPVFEAELASKPSGSASSSTAAANNNNNNASSTGAGPTTAGTGSLTTQPGAGGAEGRGLGFGRYNDRHVLQMIAHSALDVVEDVQFTNGAMYLKAVDRINEWTTSVFLLPTNVKFLILHEHKHDDGIRNFFLDVWENFVKISMNPFHDVNAPIRNASFENRIRLSARKHL